MSYPHPLGCQWCGGPYNGGNCPSCSMVESGNGSVYNQDPYSYHNTTGLFHQLPHCENQQFYCCEYCGGSHYSYDCQSGNTLVYEQVPDNNHDYNTYDSQPPQFYCCEYCGGPHFSSDCQTGNPFPCNNYDYPYQDQPPQYQMNQATLHDDTTDLLLKSLEILKELKEELAMSSQNSHEKSMEVLLAEERAAKLDSQIAFEKSIKESIAKEKAARSSSRFRFIPDDSDDEDTLDILQFYKNSSSSSVEIPTMEIQGEKTMMELLAEEQMENIKQMYASPSQLPQSTAITPEAPTHSLNMGDELLDTVPEKESDEFIKSSVENLVPIQRESQGTFDHVCDIPPPLVFQNDHIEMFSDSDEDYSLSCGDISVGELPSELVIISDPPHSFTPFEGSDFILEEIEAYLSSDSVSPEIDHAPIDIEGDILLLEKLLNNDPSSSPHQELHKEEIQTIEKSDDLPPILVPLKLSPLECSNDHFETFSDLSDDCASYENIEYVEASLPQSDPLLEEFTDELAHISPLSSESGDDLFDFEADLGEIESLPYNDHSLNSCPISDSSIPSLTPDEEDDNFWNEVDAFLSDESIPTGIDNTCFDLEGDILFLENLLIEEPFPVLPPGNFVANHHTSFKSKLKNLTNGDLLLTDEEWDCIVMHIFIPFFTNDVVSRSLFSFGNEDTIFDPGIFIYHF